ncbi:MAG: flagellar hook-associated protein FlgK, partial [Sphingomonadales bacterium]|nr:flagellar hook-associated protein FlgK [Sphingomonadales bacterium]
MASDLLSIGRSGAQAARIALDVTAQNIANASSEGYVRRSARMAEVSSTGGFGRIGDVSLSGVRLDSVVRNADVFRQAEVRRTGADAARASAEVAGLENTEAAVEQSGVYDAMVKFEGALQQLVGDPTSDSLRASVIEDARTLVGTFNIASNALDSVGTGLRFEAADGVTQVNTLAAQLGQVNLRLARASDASSDQTALLDQRDSLLQQLSTFTDVSTSIATDNTVS